MQRTQYFFSTWKTLTLTVKIKIIGLNFESKSVFGIDFKKCF